MIAHRTGSAAYYRARQTPIVKAKRERPHHIPERSRDYELEAAREWCEIYLPGLDQTDTDRLIRAAGSIQSQLAAGECPTVDAIPPAPVKAARRRAVAVKPAHGGTCPRCAQAFRYPTGRAWHLANRPDCVAEGRSRAARLAA